MFLFRHAQTASLTPSHAVPRTLHLVLLQGTAIRAHARVSVCLVHIARLSRFQAGVLEIENATESKALFAKEAIPRIRMAAMVKNIP